MDSTAITSEAECLSAAIAAGKKYAGNETSPDQPRGCYILNDEVRLNFDATNPTSPLAQLLCAIRTGPSLACAFTSLPVQ